MNFKEHPIRTDYSGWIVQVFLHKTSDLEISLLPSETARQAPSGPEMLARSLRLQGVGEMQIWDFGLVRYDLLSYLTVLPAGEKAGVFFASPDGCHGQIFCSTVQESAFEGDGRWIAEYVPEKQDSLPQGDKHPGIRNNWHDYDVVGFLRYPDEVQMLLSYPQAENAVEGQFPLAGKITFAGVRRHDISNFKSRNVLSYIKVKQNKGNLLADFDCSVGCHGLITCREVEEWSWAVKGDWKISFRP